ncbi:MAG: hypothetical protein ACYCVV_16465 [Acidimicrobiales bacterium]
MPGTMFVLWSSPFGGKLEVVVHPAAKTSDYDLTRVQKSQLRVDHVVGAPGGPLRDPPGAPSDDQRAARTNFLYVFENLMDCAILIPTGSLLAGC